VISLSEFGISDPQCQEYSPVAYRTLQRAFGLLTISPGKDVFLDLGCGMGRAVIMAAMRPFRRVIGVELIPDLCRIANDNIRRSSSRLACKDVSIVNADVRDYEIPEDVTVVYCANAFRGAILDAVVAKLSNHVVKNRQKTTLLFFNLSVFGELTRASPWVTKREERNFFPNLGFAAYDCFPP
jgi:predicted RNA methylase